MRTRARRPARDGAPAPLRRVAPARGRSTSSSTRPGPGELLVRVRAAGLCHSDLSVIDGSRPRVMPMVLGHEAAGEVRGRRRRASAASPPATTSCWPSSPRAGTASPAAPAAPRSASPARPPTPPASCWAAGAALRTADGEPLHHHLGVSAFAEHAVVSARSAVRVDPELPFELAALFGCAVLTGAGRRDPLGRGRARRPRRGLRARRGRPGRAARRASSAGAATIVAIDVVPEKLDLALELGATHAVAGGPGRRRRGPRAHRRRRRPGRRDRRQRARAGRGLRRHAPRRHDGHRRPAGPEPDAVDPGREPRRRGAHAARLLPRARRVPARDIPSSSPLYGQGRLPVDRLLTHRLGLDELNEGFDRLARGEAVRQAVVL